MIVGGIRSEYLSIFTDFVASAPYMQDDLTWCVSPAKPIPRWQNLYFIIKNVSTFILGAIFGIATILIRYAFTTFEKKPLDFWYCVMMTGQVVSGLPATYKPKKPLTRVHFALFLIIAFWLDQIFSSFLITYAQRILYKYQISTLNDIGEIDFRLAGGPYTFDYLSGLKMVCRYIMLSFVTETEVIIFDYLVIRRIFFSILQTVFAETIAHFRSLQ